MTRYAAKRDANEEEIVKGLRKIGAFVWIIDASKRGGQPDLLVFYRDYYTPLEVKSKRGRLTEAQKNAPRFPIARTLEEAKKAIGAT